MLDFYADWCISCKELERFNKIPGGPIILKRAIKALSVASLAVNIKFMWLGTKRMERFAK
jgi:thiol-disulfide isomerase/thioredoxin